MPSQFNLIRFFHCLAVATMLSAPIHATASDMHKAYQLPSEIAGVKAHVIDLNGDWQLRFTPRSKWTKVKVPGEIAMQGYGASHDTPVLFKRTFNVPADFDGKTIVLRFDGTYSYARLYVNGKEARTHRGGFTRWETDITSLLKPGKKNSIELSLTDPTDEISYAAGYAHHPILGILRDVTLFAVPKAHMTNFELRTDLDSTYKDATLRLSFDYNNGKAGDRADIRLTTPDGKPLPTVKMPLTNGKNSIEIPMMSPTKWDAEHPNLYHIGIDIFDNEGNISQTMGRKFGVRDIKIAGNRMLVNGAPVKLRGACRHDVHPTLGRSIDAELDSLDAVLFKEANMNFVRTSHYPPTERFAELCDKYGIYIECETAVCFVDTYRQKTYSPGASESDSTHSAQYLSQIKEMASTFSSHPSVLFWSIGNESVYGSNFDKSMKLIRELDNTRPVIFSYPGTVPADSTSMYDILSFHYPGISGNMNQWGKQTISFNATEGKPAIFDEWAHPACYTYATLQEDPGIREFWGESIEKLWDGVYKNSGALGGAIWGYIDERFMLPSPNTGNDNWREYAHTAKPEGFRGKCVGYGDWGIVDVWRRKKPEFASTKRAYSPVRLESPRSVNAFPGTPIHLTVANRFDHTDLSEITGRYTYKGQSGPIAGSHAQPGHKGLFTVPALDWEDGEELTIDFLSAHGDTIDSYLLTIGSPKIDMPKAQRSSKALRVERNHDATVIIGQNFRVPVSKTSGLLTDVTLNNDVMIESGPYLHAYINYNHLTGAEVREIASHLNLNPALWNPSKTTVSDPDAQGNVKVLISGTYGEKIKAEYIITVTPSGVLNFSYETQGLPEGYARATGLMFEMPESYETVSWHRNGILDKYPAYAMSGNKGKVKLTNDYVPAYGEKPEQEWADDTHDYYYWADKGSDVDNPLRMSAKSLKENIYYYTLKGHGGQLSVTDRSANTACRLSRTPNGDYLYVDNIWDYPEIAWGNYCKAISALPVAGSVTMLLSNE